MQFADSQLSCDAFLGGRVNIWQPLQGYRAATDPVLLAAACPAQPGDTVLELGCGVGTSSLCLANRIPVRLTGVEMQPDYADLARRNAAENETDMAVIIADLSALPPTLTAQSFDHVIMNPPFYGAGTPSPNAGRDIAMREDTPLGVWVDSALRRLKPKGWLTMIHQPDALSDLLIALKSRAGAITIKPLAPRTGRPASRIIVRARKGSRAATQLLNPLILHQGNAHSNDGDDFSPHAQRILRHGEALGF